MRDRRRPFGRRRGVSLHRRQASLVCGVYRRRAADSRRTLPCRGPRGIQHGPSASLPLRRWATRCVGREYTGTRAAVTDRQTHTWLLEDLGEYNMLPALHCHSAVKPRGALDVNTQAQRQLWQTDRRTETHMVTRGPRGIQHDHSASLLLRCWATRCVGCEYIGTTAAVTDRQTDRHTWSLEDLGEYNMVPALHCYTTGTVKPWRTNKLYVAHDKHDVAQTSATTTTHTSHTYPMMMPAAVNTDRQQTLLLQ